MRAVLVAMLLSVAFGARAGEAQSPGSNPATEAAEADGSGGGISELHDSTAESPVTGVTLPPGHWAVGALERAGALLLLPGWLPNQRAVPLEVIESRLREAVLEARMRHPSLLPLAEQWYARLIGEFPGLAAAGRPGWRLIQRRAGIALDVREGAAAPGLGEFEPDRTGALELVDRQKPLFAADVAAAWSRHLSIAGAFQADSDDFRVIRMELAAGVGRWRASVGRGEVGYGHGVGGGVVLTGDAPIDAVQLGTREALELPGLARPLGRLSFHTFLGRLEEDRHPDTPYLWGASVRVQPNRRFTLGVNRAAMFGGDEAVTLDRVASMLIGRVKGVGFENQIVTVSGRLILPTEDFLPATLHLEWGAEDAAGSWWAVPGIVGGLSIPSVPRVPALALGVEYAHFGTSCCSNPSWYRHWSFIGAWASRDRPLGHPLGGHGSELTLAGTLDRREGRVRGRAFRRDRGSENLFAPERAGVSHGVAASVEWTPLDSWQLRVEGSHETGVSWSESRIRIGIEYF